jgi:hypothetical protein
MEPISYTDPTSSPFWPSYMAGSEKNDPTLNVEYNQCVSQQDQEHISPLVQRQSITIPNLSGLRSCSSRDSLVARNIITYIARHSMQPPVADYPARGRTTAGISSQTLTGLPILTGIPSRQSSRGTQCLDKLYSRRLTVCAAY